MGVLVERKARPSWGLVESGLCILLVLSAAEGNESPLFPRASVSASRLVKQPVRIQFVPKNKNVLRPW